MRTRSKRFKAVATKVEKKNYTIAEAVQRVKETATAKFQEGVDIAVRLGVDPKKADQAIRGTVALPHGIGKAVRVLVIAKPPGMTKRRPPAPTMSDFRTTWRKFREAGRMWMSSLRLPM